MPRSDESQVTLKKHRKERWSKLAVDLGYGERGKAKLLDRLMDVAESLPIFFRSR